MAKRATKTVSAKTVRYEPNRVMLMVAVVSVLTIVLFGAITML